MRSWLVAALLAASYSAARAQTVICIDPGHSRKTVGTHGRKIAEYKIVWQIAARLKTLLEADGDKVVLTKTSADEDVSNPGRAAIANKAGATLFLRLHCDADNDTGTATFYPDRQGRVGGVKGPSNDIIAQSRRMATAFHHALMASLHGHLADRGLRTDSRTHIGGKQGGALTGSIYSHVPVLLVEMCVLTNRKDEEFITSTTGQDLMAHALASGVKAAISHE